MNDFTKEELEDIHYGISEYGHLEEEARIVPLIIKVAEMIDNYCEHEKEGSVGLHNLCIKCGWIGL